MSTIEPAFAGDRTFQRLNTLAPIFIILTTFLFYIPAMRGGYIWDDNAHVLFDPVLHGLEGLYNIWFTRATQQYYPLVYSSFWIEWQLWGAAPLGYHLVNISLHSINAVLVALILKRLGLRGAWAVALIFALHPVHVESVAWVSERKNLLSGLFYLCSIFTYLKYEEDGERRQYAFALLFFIFALMSKTVVCTLPVVLIILRWMRHGRIDRGYLIRLLPFFLAGLLMGLLTVWWEATQVGATGAEWDMSLLERLMIPARAVWFYIFKLFLPARLIFIYPRWSLDPTELIQWLYPIKLFIAFAVLWAFKKKISRMPVAMLACFVVTLLPALGFINVYPFRYSFVADHFQYLASIFIIILTVTTVSTLIDGLVLRVKGTAVFVTIAVALLLGALTWNQSHVYRDETTLWRDVLSKNPDAWIGHNNLGKILYARGEEDKALAHYKSAVELWPKALEAQHNLASTLFKIGKLKDAESHFRLALEINPNEAHTLSELAILISETGRVAEATRMSLKAVTIEALDADILNGRAIVLIRSGRAGEALRYLKKAISIRPDFINAYSNTGVALSILGKNNEALTAFKEALSLDPSYAEGHYNLAVTYQDLAETEEAETHYKEAARLDPSHVKALNNLGNIYYKRGDITKAQGYYRAALKVNPNFSEALRNLRSTSHHKK